MQQDSQQSWRVAVDSVGARCTVQKGKNHHAPIASCATRSKALTTAAQKLVYGQQHTRCFALDCLPDVEKLVHGFACLLLEVIIASLATFVEATFTRKTW